MLLLQKLNMKFDLVFQLLIKENSEENTRKRYKVSCYKYAFTRETTAASPEQAKSYVGAIYAQSKNFKRKTPQYETIIKDFVKCAKVKEIV